MKIWRWTIPIWVVVAVLIVAVPVAALTYRWVIQCSVDITDGEQNPVVYSDPTCTANLTNQYFGKLELNHANVITVYVKNEGSANTTNKMIVDGNTDFGFVLFVPAGEFTLAPQGIQPVEVTIYVSPEASIGRHNFSIIAGE